MSNIQVVLSTLVGTSFTFNPQEKGKDRPTQTIAIKDFIMSNEFGPQFACEIEYPLHGKQIKINRYLSVVRVMEYMAQAAVQGK